MGPVERAAEHSETRGGRPERRPGHRQTKISEGRLSLHPIVIFGSTIAGAATLGLLGAALSTPAVAIVVRVVRRLSAVNGQTDRLTAAGQLVGVSGGVVPGSGAVGAGPGAG